LPPYELDNVIGRTLRHPLAEGAGFTFDDLEELTPGTLEPAGVAVRADDER
jgi:hypothetical protein